MNDPSCFLPVRFPSSLTSKTPFFISASSLAKQDTYFTQIHTLIFVGVSQSRMAEDSSGCLLGGLSPLLQSLLNAAVLFLKSSNQKGQQEGFSAVGREDVSGRCLTMTVLGSSGTASSPSCCAWQRISLPCHGGKKLDTSKEP